MMGRYERHEQLKGFGKTAQQKLKSSKVLVVGLGGLGTPVVQYLNAMGIGALGLVDADVININNLQRQVLYAENEVGVSKVTMAQTKLEAQNSQTDITVFETYLSAENALGIIKNYDLVVDATDNFATRYLINDACVILNKPFVYGALHAFEGQVSVFNYQNGPTYRCLFPTMPKPDEIPNCDQNGVLGILPGIVGSLQTLEVVKVITGIGNVLSGTLLLYDGLTQHTQHINFKKNLKNLDITELSNGYGQSGCEIFPTITADDFIALNDKIQLIDVRNHSEFEHDHLPGATCIPLSDLSKNSHRIDFNNEVYVICQSGKRSALAVQQLAAVYPRAKVFSVDGGMNQIKTACR